MNNLLIIIFIAIIIIIIFMNINKNITEHFITTWTPYTIDPYNQPTYYNYFYKNGYYYPL
jgi:hypothetical protein